LKKNQKALCNIINDLHLKNGVRFYIKNASTEFHQEPSTSLIKICFCKILFSLENRHFPKSFAVWDFSKLQNKISKGN